MDWVFGAYQKLAKETNEAVSREHAFYQNLRTQIQKVRYSEKWVQGILGTDTHILEKKIYFKRAKRIAFEILGHCEHGAFLAVDDKMKAFYDAQEAGKHKTAINGFADESRNLYNAVILKFPQVEEGIKHLESLLS